MKSLFICYETDIRSSALARSVIEAAYLWGFPICLYCTIEIILRW